MADVLSLSEITLLIILAVLAAIVYSLRVLVLLERRIARMDENLQHIVLKIAKEEYKIESMITSKKSVAPKKKSSKKK